MPRAPREWPTGGDVPVLAVNACDPAAADALAPWLRPGTTAVLVGSSGAGKSTLTNTLLGQARMKTGQVRERDARGRHTTTYRALVPLPSGACLIDTPGMRELKPTGEEALDDGFADIEALAAVCRFRDCRHQAEPGCAVRAAVEAGDLDPAGWELPGCRRSARAATGWRAARAPGGTRWPAARRARPPDARRPPGRRAAGPEAAPTHPACCQHVPAQCPAP